ncbi:MAG: UxaA family hydrolase [Candidatus Dormibacteraeota bacterium]|nr:UxaA family hydrolase [Candidatus Dormibacteraeota bacterium]
MSGVYPPAARPRVLKLHPRDNVAVAVRPLEAGELVVLEEETVAVAEPIPFGHKLALQMIPKGGDVRKYGEVVGRATSEIGCGHHVHVHNVVSARLPGQGE